MANRIFVERPNWCVSKARLLTLAKFLDQLSHVRGPRFLYQTGLNCICNSKAPGEVPVGSLAWWVAVVPDFMKVGLDFLNGAPVVNEKTVFYEEHGIRALSTFFGLTHVQTHFVFECGYRYRGCDSPSEGAAVPVVAQHIRSFVAKNRPFALTVSRFW